LYSLDAPVPLELEGQHFDAVIEPTYLDAHPVRRGTLSSQAKERAAEEEPVWDEEDEALVLRRLQALGYVE
jgi:hypothetical protein